MTFPGPLSGGGTLTSAVVDIAPDGTKSYGELDDAYTEVIPGVNPETGEPDGRYDGRITVSVPIGRAGEAVHPSPNPQVPGLVEVVRPSALVFARDLGVGLAEYAEDERLREQAAQIRRSLDERYR